MLKYEYSHVLQYGGVLHLPSYLFREIIIHSQQTTTIRQPHFVEDINLHHYVLSSQKLETDEDDSYLNSGWSDPQSLKRQFHGVGNVKWRP